MQQLKIQILILSLFVLAFTYSTFSQPAGMRYTPVISSLQNPVEIVSPNDDTHRLFVVEKQGAIKVYNQAYEYLADFLKVDGITSSGERGLLSMAFHPSYKTNGLFFVYYTNSQGSIEVASYKVSNDMNIANPASKKVIITIPHPGAANHNGGRLSFGTDGYLYFGTGDGGGGGDPNNNAQNGTSLLGKMLRINVDIPNPPLNYSIPDDNPFINNPAIADEIWAFGLRNPWRWSFDRLTGDMWIADVGQGAREEINVAKAGNTKGLNYGWRCYEGTRAYNLSNCAAADQYVSPVFEYPHYQTAGGYAVTGGFVYRGLEYPGFYGYYIFADYQSRNHWVIKDSSDSWQAIKLNGLTPMSISGFGEAQDGSIYACSLSLGIVYKLEPLTGVIFQILNFTATANNNIIDLNWSAVEQELQYYEVERSLDSLNFELVGTLPAQNLTTVNNYRFTDFASDSKIFYRLRSVNKDGRWDYSSTITVFNRPGEQFIFPTTITNNIISIFLPGAFDQLEVFSMTGALVIKKDIRGMIGRIDIPVYNLVRGLYMVRLVRGSEKRVQRILIL